MNKLKGVKKLERKMNKIICRYTGEDFPCHLGVDFECDLISRDIAFSLFVQEHSDRLWREFILDEYGVEVNDVVFFSLLHEIGHLISNDLDSEEYRISEEVKPFIQEQLDSLVWHSYEWASKYKEYFALPIERQATEWALEFYQTPQARDMYSDIEDIVLAFLDKNRVTDF